MWVLRNGSTFQFFCTFFDGKFALLLHLHIYIALLYRKLTSLVVMMVKGGGRHEYVKEKYCMSKRGLVCNPHFLSHSLSANISVEVTKTLQYAAFSSMWHIRSTCWNRQEKRRKPDKTRDRDEREAAVCSFLLFQKNILWSQSLVFCVLSSWGTAAAEFAKLKTLTPSRK